MTRYTVRTDMIPPDFLRRGLVAAQENVMTIDQFIKSTGVTATIKRADVNPYIDDDWARSADHWSVWLRCGRSRMHIYLSMGSDHNGRPPSVADVLDSLASDAESYPLESGEEAFADWCGNYGYDTDSRKAHRTFKIIGQQTERLKRLLGSSALYTLCCDVERL